MSELFKIEPSLSPEAQYIQQAGLATWQGADQNGYDGEWFAAAIDAPSVSETARTKLEAVSNFQQKHGKPSYDEWRMQQSKQNNE